MQYLVSTTNTPEFQWQLELLIQSFKYHNIEDKLLVCLADTNSPQMFWKNIPSHQNIKFHENIGRIRGYEKLNFLYSMLWSQELSWINSTFTLIPPDSVIYEPLKLNLGVNSEIVFLPDPFFTFDYVQENIGDFWQFLENDKEFYKDNWLNVGDIVVFHRLDKSFFLRMIIAAERLALAQLINNKNIWEHTAKVVLAAIITEYVNSIKIHGEYDLAAGMTEYRNSKFIHYEHGLPPVFNKSMFKYLPPDFLSFGNPFEILKDNFPTQNSHFISELARSYLDF